jgi:hypothetical protein
VKDLWDIIKRSNLRIMGIEEVEEVKPKDIDTKVNKIIGENFLHLEKEKVI